MRHLETALHTGVLSAFKRDRGYTVGATSHTLSLSHSLDISKAIKLREINCILFGKFVIEIVHDLGCGLLYTSTEIFVQ